MNGSIILWFVIVVMALEIAQLMYSLYWLKVCIGYCLDRLDDIESQPTSLTSVKSVPDSHKLN